MIKNLIKYKVHQGEIIKIGRITSRIKEIRFDPNKKRESNKNSINQTKNDKIDSNSIDNSKSNNHFLLKDIDGDILLEEKKFKNFNYDKIIDMAIQRNATDSDLKEKIQIVNVKSKNKIKAINKSPTSEDKPKEKENKKIDKICRICLDQEIEEENPIVQPCKCSGSCKYIHLNCLKQWINTKSCLKIDENEFCSVFVFTETECELCKSKLPDFVQHNEKLYNLLDFSDEFDNYLVLESLTLDKENNKFLYVISLDKKKI